MIRETENVQSSCIFYRNNKVESTHKKGTGNTHKKGTGNTQKMEELKRMTKNEGT